MATKDFGKCNTANQIVQAWVEEMAKLCQPDRVFWCDGSEEERQHLTDQAVQEGILVKLNQEKLPGCYYHRSSANDVARVEERTFICTPTKKEVGPTNNWMPPQEMYQKLYGMAQGAMKGRTLYVVPYLMGPKGSDLTKVGIEITDSLYVVLSMGVMTRMGEVTFEHLGKGEAFNKGLHCMLNVDPERRFIAHFPQDNTVISLASNYGGNVLLGKKCLALRIGSYLGRDQGWMAEHMLILAVEAPTGERTYIAAAFPSACGKTNFAMLVPPKRFNGWKIWTIGDDIAWMKPGADGRLYAINPENGYFGVVPGTNWKSNPNAMASIQKDTIYTNVGLTDDLNVWWEGKDNTPPSQLTDWQGNPWTPGCGRKAAHANSRFAAPQHNNPALAPEADDPQGVPIDAIIFGGRRGTTLPLICQSFDWSHGVYLGATMGSEMTAAAVGGAGQVRRDPMAMIPFCGYDMGDYFSHWLHMRKTVTHLPKVFGVNWFRKNQKGEFLWPGFSENMRILQWIVQRCRGNVDARETPLGWMPHTKDIDLEGMDGFTQKQFEAAQKIDTKEWEQELLQQNDIFFKLRRTIPKELIFQRELLLNRL